MMHRLFDFLIPLRLTVLMVLAFSMTGCGGGGREQVRPSPYASQGQSAGYYKIGRPYKIKGQWYNPQEDYSYDETGIASWYGADFHNRLTANGEVYNKNELTAAHKTLPLPSLARVTNLENGRSLVVRVNDRGPFSGARIIDVSQRTAQLLGFERQGTAKVRVQVMAEESKAIADAMRSYGGQPPAPQTQVQTVASYEPDAVETYPLQPESIKTFKPVPVVEQTVVTGENKIYVQAGSFTNQENARRLQSKMSQVGHAIMSPATVNQVQYYRVRVGPMASVADADAMLKKVKQSGAESARIIVD